MKKIIYIILIISLFFVSINNTYALNNNSYLLTGIGECADIFAADSKAIEFLQEIFDIIKWLGPLLCLALSVVEFVKATASQDKDALKKAAQKTGKRIILALLLFFLPALIDTIFWIIGYQNGTCGIK